MKAMNQDTPESICSLMGLLFQAHPWHGISAGTRCPQVVTTYIEIVPSDTVKYELDKITGHLKIDRPQRYSNVCPALYGLIPQTFCGEKLAELSMKRTGRTGIAGDGDPLDICVLAESTISHGNILLQSVPIGGLRMLDGNEADDKIISVMEGDPAYGGWKDISDVPTQLLDRLRHYFLTYKHGPDATHIDCEITHVYNRQEAHEVITRCHEDYQARFGNIEGLLAAALRG
jgi:inorganic pyrophosphatase